MGFITNLSDKLVNLVSSMGTDRDKASGSVYEQTVLTDQELINAYRGAWLPRKIVDIPALDATRRWRGWQADKDQIEKIEAEEKRLDVRRKIKTAMTRARLLGGAAILIGTGERDTSQPLKADRLGLSGIKYLTVLSRRQLVATEIDQDVLSDLFGKPKGYRLTGSGFDIHPSRLVIFTGAEHPDPSQAMDASAGWGDSVLQALFEAIKQSDGTMANAASLVFEAKVDVIKIPDFMRQLEDPAFAKQVLQRIRLANTAKGINGAILLDAQEDYDSKQVNFGGLPDIMDRFLQQVSGAADIPATRLLSQSPSGLNSTGESDLRNYYDRIQAMQELDVGPAMSVLDECLIRSALGLRPDEIHYVWHSLWQPTATDRATIGKTTADTLKVLGDTKLWPPEVLSQVGTTMLVEQGVMPGLEAAIDQYGKIEFEEDGGQGNDDLPPQKTITDAAPRTLYVSRKVTNGADIIAWAKSQGFANPVPAEDLHVTIAYSTQLVDWMKVGESWSGDSKGLLKIAPGGARLIDKFGEGAIVLLFNSSELAWRHVSIVEAGASWDWPEYQPHITFTYDPGAVDIGKVEPYRGAIELGPEIFEEVKS
ncbi:phage portal protein [Pseudomonas sp. RC10]|uniref:anti-CBASS protein Acb1 family protein n=1 Tax=Pseudomonas bambusae TaxID=3139142 RepID=UPI003139F015